MALPKEVWRDKIMQMASGTTGSPYQEFNEKSSPSSYKKPGEGLKDLPKQKETYQQLKLPIKGARVHDAWQQYLANKLAGMGGSIAELQEAQINERMKIQPLSGPMIDQYGRQLVPSGRDAGPEPLYDESGNLINTNKIMDWRYNQ